MSDILPWIIVVMGNLIYWLTWLDFWRTSRQIHFTYRFDRSEVLEAAGVQDLVASTA